MNYRSRGYDRTDTLPARKVTGVFSLVGENINTKLFIIISVVLGWVANHLASELPPDLSPRMKKNNMAAKYILSVFKVLLC